MKRILVTGAAGFIGSFLSKKLLEQGCEVVGIDNLNDYYDPALKRERLRWRALPAFTFQELDLADRAGMFPGSHALHGIPWLMRRILTFPCSAWEPEERSLACVGMTAGSARGQRDLNPSHFSLRSK